VTLRDHLQQATDDLDWINTAPHALDHLIGVDRERRAREAEAEAVPTEGRAYGDPTGAIGAGPGAGALADTEGPEVVPQVDHALETVWLGSRTLAANVARWHGEPSSLPPMTDLRTGRVNQALVNVAGVMTRVDDLDWLSGEEQAGLLFVVRDEIAELSRWLRTWAEGVYASAPKIAARAVEQRTRLNCQCHHGHGFDVNVIGSKALCERCLAFKKAYGFLPNERVARLFYEHPRRWPSEGMVAEARLASKGRPRGGQAAVGSAS
jgi:hypothetical protein